jgi:amino acid transporter
MEISGHQPAKLRKELNVWEAIGISLALMAPSMAANINPQFVSSAVGRAVPLAFLFATVGILLVAYGFVRLTQQFHHAGSVYGFVGVTLGPRAGVFAGFALMGTYIFYACVTATAAGRFGADFLQRLGLISADSLIFVQLAVAFVAIALAWFLALVPARDGTRILLAVEGVTVAVILVTVVVILAHLLGGSAPNGSTFNLNVFTLPEGSGLNALMVGSVFGFLSFAGFEAAATLGEEAHHPQRDIPRAILGVAVFGGLYFVVVTAIEVMGFGGDAGMKAFGSSNSLLGDLGAQYIGSWIGDVITIGAAISAFGCCLACLVGASRLLYALGRDSAKTPVLGIAARVSTRWGTPSGALAIVTAVAAIIVAVWATAFGANATAIFNGSGVIGTLILLVAYAFATIGAIKFLFFSGKARVPMYEIVVPIAALVFLALTLWNNITFDTTTDGFKDQVVVIVWLLLGAALVFGLPGLARRVGESLEADEGLIAAKS